MIFLKINNNNSLHFYSAFSGHPRRFTGAWARSRVRVEVKEVKGRMKGNIVCF